MDVPQVIFEDDYLMALSKPSGYVVNDSDSAHGNPTLQEFIRNNFSFSISKDRELRNGIVHRLDKPTSGVILLAKKKEVFESLQRLFFERKVKKTYLALVHGNIKDDKGEINEPVGRLPWKRTKFGVYEGGREALTKYEVLKRYGEYTFLRLFPRTGRTHQIRVHLKHIGHPVVADPLYAGRKMYRADLKKWPRLFLHAESIEFEHPVTRKVVKIEAPLFSDLRLPDA